MVKDIYGDTIYTKMNAYAEDLAIISREFLKMNTIVQSIMKIAANNDLQ